MGSCSCYTWAIILLRCFFIINYPCNFALQIVSGDDDLPKRDDIGERRRKHELRVLSGAGIVSGDDVGDGPGTVGNNEDNDVDDFYKQVEQQRAAKLAAKSEMYANTFSMLSYGPHSKLLALTSLPICSSFIWQSSPFNKVVNFHEKNLKFFSTNQIISVDY